jgi:hypothetical protein
VSETCGQQRLLERRDLPEQRGIDGEVAVRGVGRDREIGLAHAEIDRLRTDENDCAAM